MLNKIICLSVKHCIHRKSTSHPPTN